MDSKRSSETYVKGSTNKLLGIENTSEERKCKRRKLDSMENSRSNLEVLEEEWSMEEENNTTGSTEEAARTLADPEFFNKILGKLSEMQDDAYDSHKLLTELGFQAATLLTHIKVALAKYKLYISLLQQGTATADVVDLPAFVAEAEKSVIDLTCLESSIFFKHI